MLGGEGGDGMLGQGRGGMCQLPYPASSIPTLCGH